MLTTVTPIARNRTAPRVWMEGIRLAALGFAAGSTFSIATAADGIGVNLTPDAAGARKVSYRDQAGVRRPIIDLNSGVALGKLADYDEAKVVATNGLIRVTPTRRAFSILSHRSAIAAGRIPVVEFFGGIGIMSEALHADPRFEVMCALEFEARFADSYSVKYPGTPVMHMDIRDFDPADAPNGALFVIGLPCTDHSNAGRAKKGLAGKPELGESGDLFVPVLAAIRAQMPVAILLEQVPAFKDSYADQVFVAALRKYGYHVTRTVLEPHTEWGEIQDRPRYCLVATLDAPFEVRAPMTPFVGKAGDFLDAPDAELDAADYARHARTFATLDRHFAKHKAKGNGFNYTVIDRESTRIPTITKSYHKVNNGPFVRLDGGRLRMLRKGELERIFGATAVTETYTTAVEGLGQGVLPRVFARILGDLADHLLSPAPLAPVKPAPAALSQQVLEFAA